MGAVESAGEPAGDDGLLAQAAFRPATPNLVDDYAWWIVPGVPRDVLAFVRSHVPAGARRVEHGIGLSGPGVPVNETETFELPGVVAGISGGGPSIVLHAVQLPGESTGLRADAQAVWITPRPSSEVIPAGARPLAVSVLTLSHHSPPRQHERTPRSFTVTSSKRIDEIAALVNALPVTQPGILKCPADFGTRVKLVFYAHRHSRPLAVIEIDPQGCGEVALTIGGVVQPSLQEGPMLVDQLERVLRRRLRPTP